jgi:hypothetical protein
MVSHPEALTVSFSTAPVLYMHFMVQPADTAGVNKILTCASNMNRVCPDTEI